MTRRMIFAAVAVLGLGIVVTDTRTADAVNCYDCFSVNTCRSELAGYKNCSVTCSGGYCECIAYGDECGPG